MHGDSNRTSQAHRYRRKQLGVKKRWETCIENKVLEPARTPEPKTPSPTRPKFPRLHQQTLQTQLLPSLISANNNTELTLLDLQVHQLKPTSTSHKSRRNFMCRTPRRHTSEDESLTTAVIGDGHHDLVWQHGCLGVKVGVVGLYALSGDEFTHDHCSVAGRGVFVVGGVVRLGNGMVRMNCTTKGSRVTYWSWTTGTSDAAQEQLLQLDGKLEAVRICCREIQRC